MNGTINGGIPAPPRLVQLRQLHAWLREHVNLVLLGLNAFVLLSLCYVALSWAIIEIRSRPLLVIADLTGKSAPANKSPGEKRGDASPRADRLEKPSDPEAAQRKEKLAQLEQRALFGEPKPTVQPPRVEAIFGELALIDGKWLAAGGKANDYTVVEIQIDKVAMTDRDGRRQEFGLAAGESGSGPNPPPSSMKGVGGAPDGLGGDSQKPGTAKDVASETKRSFDAPQNILAAIKQHSPDGTLKKVKWDSQRGVYSIETSTSDGRDIDMKLGSDGSLQVKDEEVRMADLPRRVNAAVKQRLGDGGTISDLKRWVRDGRTSYEAEIKTGTQKTTIQLAEDGTLLTRN